MAAAGAAAIDQGPLSALASELTRPLRIDRIGVASGRAEGVEFGRVEIGDATVEGASAPVTVRGVELSGLQLDQLSAQRIRA